MGGCRCSYRNCNVKSDGKTHMFHYPVFDRLRCHQWLLNAHKLDFLNLKVSQLKNRVVCQHHFKDDNFMNFKKDKLTFDAVPTESGPFCDPTQFADSNEENVQSFPLIMEDIENESLLYCDKRANYSVKYGDFLTNNEIYFMNPDKNVNLNLSNRLDGNRVEKVKRNQPVTIKGVHQYSNKLSFESDTSKLINSFKPSEASPVGKSISNTLKFQDNIQVQVNVTSIEKEETVTEVSAPSEPLQNQNSSQKKVSKIKIISEKKIRDPITLPKDLQSVSPSAIITIPKKKKPQQVYSLDLSAQPSLNIGESTSTKPQQLEASQIQESQQTKQLPDEGEVTSTDNFISQPITRKTITKSQPRQVKSKVSLLKNKISPQRIAAIEEKRKFNMKLRDMIETCLDKRTLDRKEDPQIVVSSKVDAIENQSNNVKPNSPQGGSKKSELPKAHEVAKYLDERLRRLENTLLNRIDQNTQKITELKNSISQTPMKMTSSSVQTLGNEECYKKYLYQEISKFLSPSSNSIVYEELFINKYSLEKDNVQTNTKRRRCR